MPLVLFDVEVEGIVDNLAASTVSSLLEVPGGTSKDEVLPRGDAWHHDTCHVPLGDLMRNLWV